jgi:hypothetical protein
MMRGNCGKRPLRGNYALAYQLVGDSFRESLGEGQRYTDDRMRLIEEFGVITPRALSEKYSVSPAAIPGGMKTVNIGKCTISALKKAILMGRMLVIMSK